MFRQNTMIVHSMVSREAQFTVYTCMRMCSIEWTKYASWIQCARQMGLTAPLANWLTVTYSCLQDCERSIMSLLQAISRDPQDRQVHSVTRNRMCIDERMNAQLCYITKWKNKSQTDGGAILGKFHVTNIHCARQPAPLFITVQQCLSTPFTNTQHYMF